MKEWLSGEKNKRMFETTVEALCEHLRLLGLNATAVKFNERPCVIGLLEQSLIGITGWALLGAVKVANKNIDIVELAQLAGDGDYLYRCNYVVWAKVEGIEDKVKANLKSFRKGSWWDGNELAQALNNDTDLRDRLNRMVKGWRLWFPIIETKPFKNIKASR